MRDFSNWSLNLGEWCGVQVRLHAFFLLFAVFTLYLSTRDQAAAGMGYAGPLILIILFLSVLAHEVGHSFAAFKVGGSTEQIVLGPLGGFTQPTVPHEPQHELLTALAGPLVNLAIWLLTAPLLGLAGVELTGLLNPLEPKAVVEGAPWLVALKLTFWLNWLLVLVNLLPAFPLDGGRILRSILWPAFGPRTAVLVVARGAMITAVGMCVIAWVLRDAFPTALVPAWMALLLFAIFLFFSAQQEIARLEEHDSEEELFSYDFSQGYTSLERNFERQRRRGPGPLRRWLEKRRDDKRIAQQQLEQEEESQVDAILARLHETGMDGLSAKERSLLERVSARYRNRQSS
jgi:Zn-dependent protease